MEMTLSEWEEFFGTVSAFREKNGDEALVKYIEDVIASPVSKPEEVTQ